jgi:hypothetical protein
MYNAKEATTVRYNLKDTLLKGISFQLKMRKTIQLKMSLML